MAGCLETGTRKGGQVGLSILEFLTLAQLSGLASPSCGVSEPDLKRCFVHSRMLAIDELGNPASSLLSLVEFFDALGRIARFLQLPNAVPASSSDSESHAATSGTAPSGAAMSGSQKLAFGQRLRVVVHAMCNLVTPGASTYINDKLWAALPALQFRRLADVWLEEDLVGVRPPFNFKDFAAGVLVDDSESRM